MGRVSAGAVRDWINFGRSTTWFHHFQHCANRFRLLVFSLAGAPALAVSKCVPRILDRDRIDQRNRSSAVVDSATWIQARANYSAGAIDSGADFSVATSLQRSGHRRQRSALMLSEFVTVFEITRNSNGVFVGAVFRLLIGIVALIGALRSLVRNRRRESSRRDYIGPIFVLVWSLFWIYLHNFPHVFGHIDRLMSAYQQKQYQIVEGPVQILHQQPGDRTHKRRHRSREWKRIRSELFFVHAGLPKYDRAQRCSERRNLCAHLLL